MIDRYIQINRLLRSIINKMWDALDAHMFDSESYVLSTIGSYIERDIRELERIWPEGLEKISLKKFGESIEKFDRNSVWEIVHNDIPKIEDTVDNFFSSKSKSTSPTSIIDFLHPRIIQCSYSHYKSGHYRDAVLNAFVCVFDFIRERIEIDKDGVDLIGNVFSLNDPKLVFSSIKTESGKNEQKGFMQILQGAYLGIRNPKAHSLESDLNELKTFQYLIFASLLARRIEEASEPTSVKKE